MLVLLKQGQNIEGSNYTAQGLGRTEKDCSLKKESDRKT